METIDLEIPDELLFRIERLAEQLGLTTHDFMLSAIERVVRAQDSKLTI